MAMAKPLDELTALNESPSEKEGKLPPYSETQTYLSPLNESPSEKEGKCQSARKTVNSARNPQ